MLRSKQFVTRTKKGNIVKVVKEHYLRDDIWCSIQGCNICKHTDPVLSSSPRSLVLVDGKAISHYIIPDTNTIVHQIDIFEHPALKDVIILQTVLQEVKHLSLQIYNRLRAIIADQTRRFYVFSSEHHRETFIEALKDETPNDRNDRAIRVATKWYTIHIQQFQNVKDHVKAILMLSDDAGNRAKAKQEGILSMTVRDYVEVLAPIFPELADMVSAADPAVLDRDSTKLIYEEHLGPTHITAGLKSGSLLQGTLNISMHNYLEGSIFGSVEGVERTIYIEGRKNLNRAVQGDIIAVQMLPKNDWRRGGGIVVVNEDEEKNEVTEDEGKADGSNMDLDTTDENSDAQPTGKIVGIIRRNWRPYCGVIDRKSVKLSSESSSITAPQNVTFLPMDRRIPRIRLRTRQAPGLMGKRIVVSIDSWPKDSMYPLGHFVKELGPTGDAKTETELLLLEHDVPYQEFSQQVLSCLPPEGNEWVVKEEHYKDRKDLTALNICSIDPPGCTDIDDALHARELPNGNYEVGVHIADVTHFVKPNTPLDIEAANRGSTVYLIERRIDMLPELLGTNLCSLRSNVKRLAFSCVWEMTTDAEIVKVDFFKSVIASKHSFTYEEAQKRIDDPQAQDDITKSIRNLNELAKILKKKRLEAGAVPLSSPEVRFRLERDTQDPVEVEMKELKETNALVEEFMLLANIAVAQKIQSKFSDSAMLRRHPTPPDSNFGELEKAVSRLGMEIKHSTSKEFAESLEHAVLPEDPYFNKLLRIMSTRCMLQAVYFCSGTIPPHDFRHYGLAVDIYTHFTSPIRRYSDIVVHRQLAATIDADVVYGSELTDKGRMKELCDVLNHRTRMAQQASRSSVELYTNMFFKNKIEQEEGYITKVLKNGFIVLVPKYGIEGIVYSSASPKSSNTAVTSSSPFEYNPETNSLESLATGVSITLFKRIIVQITVDEDEGSGRQKLRMSLVEPFVEGLSVPLKMNEDESVVNRNVKRVKM